MFAGSRDALVEPPLFIGEAARDRMHRHDAPADFVGNEENPARQRRQTRGKRIDLAREQRAVDHRTGLGLLRRATGEEQVGEPQRQAVDNEAGIVTGVRGERVGKMKRGLDEPPGSRPALAMMGDAPLHLAVADFGRGHIDDAQAAFRSPTFGKGALARSGATDDQFSHGSKIAQAAAGIIGRSFRAARRRFLPDSFHMSFRISAPDRGIAATLQHKIDFKTKPLGALGQLERLALQAGLVQQTLTPALTAPHMLVFAGDHGAAKAGVSAFPQDVTWQMVENFLAGGAAINVFARANGLGLKVVDAGVAHDFGVRDGLIDAKVAPGTRNYIEEAAMTPAERDTAIARGAALARELAATGCRVVGFGEMGIGNTAAASLITHHLTATPLADCIGRGTGLDDPGLARKRELLARAAGRAGLPAIANGSSAHAQAVLAEFGGFEIAMMTGAMLGAAEAGMLLLIDGFIVSSALLVAAHMYPEVLHYAVFCHRSAEPGHQAQLKAMNAETLIDLGLRLGEGTGAALAWPLLRAAVAFLNEMASFESAGVSGKG